jgi:hypothetical protein
MCEKVREKETDEKWRYRKKEKWLLGVGEKEKERVKRVEIYIIL